MTLQDNLITSIDSEAIQSVFQRLEIAFYQTRYPSLKHRIAVLNKLEQNLLEYKDQLTAAVRLDLNKSVFECETSEILTCLLELRLAKKHLKNWMRPKPVKTPTELLGSSHYIRYEPKGLVLIISPWNYPVNLSLIPLIAAWSAGNKIILKPSEYSTNTNIILKQLIAETFSVNEVQLIEGDASVSKALVQLPFNHIFFTGSQSTAKSILIEAAANLTSVTLELGGKNPLIIDESVSLKQIMPDIVYAKCINGGQTCVAPDYVLLPRSMQNEFVVEWNNTILKMYGSHPIENDDFCGIVNEVHYQRLLNLVYESVEQGAQLTEPIQCNAQNHKIKPVLLLESQWNHRSMQNENFGPVLPVIAYDSLNEEIARIQKLDRPLTLYIFSNKKDHQKYILDRLRSGGATINNCLLNYCNFNLPFGGDHQSGHGFNHGIYGFKTFSHQRSISTQGKLLNALRFFYPPFTNYKIIFKQWVFRLLGRI